MGTIAEKLSYLNNTKQLLKDSINDLGGNIDSETTFREYIDNLTEIYNDYPKVSDTGTDINLTNTKQGKLTTELNPSEIFQESTTGQQLYNYQDTKTVTYWTSDNEGWLTVSGDNTSSTTLYANYFTNNLNLNTSTNYLAVLEVKNVSGNGQFFLVSGHSSSQATRDTNVLLENLSNNTTYVYTFTTRNSFEGVNNGIRTFAGFTTGQSGSITCRISVIADTSITPSTFVYQPFTGGIPAPNPDYPFPIHTVSGENNIKIENKNFSSLKEYTFIKESTRTLDIRFTSPIPEGTYRLSCKIINKSGLTSNLGLSFQIVDDSVSPSITRGFFKAITDSTTTPYSNTQTITGQATKIYVYLSNSLEDTATITIDEIMLLKGSTATEYTPHQEQNYVINLGDLEYCKIGTYNDQIFKNTINSPYYDNTLNENEWYMKKNIKKIVLDGTENWVLNSNYQGKYRYTLELNDLIHYANNDGTEVSALSDYFKGVPTNEWSTTVNSITVISNKRLLISSEITNVTDFKTSLTTHNTIVYYVLNTPQYINITENYPTLATQLENLSKAPSYGEQTNISQTNNDLPFDLNIKALMKGD